MSMMIIAIIMLLLIALLVFRYKRFSGIVFLILALIFILPLQIVLALLNGVLLLVLTRSNIKFTNSKAYAKFINAKTNPQMSKTEAYEVLGLADTASKEEISAAYKKMIMNNHPDKGGSKYIAQKIIMAKECLLKENSL